MIPAPEKLTFDTATLLAAACCIPAILGLISMWNQVLKTNWKKSFADRHQEEGAEPIPGTNGATTELMKDVNKKIGDILSKVEIAVFAGAVLTILIIGERNFFSRQVRYQQEPIAAIGVWYFLL